MSGVRQAIKAAHGELVRTRHYSTRDAVLRGNQELQKADGVRPTDGMRAFARMPEGEMERLAAGARAGRLPSYLADLVSPDAEISSRAKIKLVNSADGACYRVGGTSRKVFHFKNNPLAKG